MFIGALGTAMIALPTATIAAPICTSAGTTFEPPAIVTVISSGPVTDVILRTPYSGVIWGPGEIIEVAGSTVRVTLLVYSHVFTPTPQLNCTVRLPTLAPGGYTLEYYRQPNATSLPVFVEARNFAVAADASAIPTLGLPALFALSALLLIAAGWCRNREP